ncbi:MAG: hypothetical protein CMO12_04540 [Thaumarchaeota archaeon]|nr:hypothetical protein [Nitrososphaerota archaeon]|tara:strand:- start:3260 stop:3745 length:486 start_codon:yes stop_codon:yes gene_type:complete
MSQQATKEIIKLNINGVDEEVAVGPYDTLSKVLRDDLGMTGTKRGCDYGGCGCCTVILNGRSIYSCMMPARKAAGGKVRTIEGLEQDGKLHPVQDAYIRNFAFQCGYCTPGFIMSSVDLLESNKNPTEMDVREGIAGNLCRCTGYIKIIEAILDAAKATEK